MLQFFSAGFPYFGYGNVEIEFDTGQGMVRVDRNRFVGNFRYCDEPGALCGFGFELHAFFDLARTLKAIDRDLDYKAVVAFAISLGSWNRNLEGIAGFFAVQGLFEPRDDILVSVDIGQRTGFLGGIQNRPSRIRQGVVDADYAILDNVHVASLR